MVEIQEDCFHMTLTGIKAGTHKTHAEFRSNSYEYEDSTSKEQYIKINKIPLTLHINGLTQHNNKDLRDTPDIELPITFTISAVDIWGNSVDPYKFPYKVYCNNTPLTSTNNQYSYTFKKAGNYTFKVESQENDKYLEDEYSETITIEDSGANETRMTLTFNNGRGTSEVYSCDRIHAEATITPNSLTDKIVMKIYFNGQLQETIQGIEYHNTSNMKKGNYKIVAEYKGDKYNLPSSSQHPFTVNLDPTDFTNLQFTTNSSGGSVSTGDLLNVTGCLKDTQSNTPLANTEYKLTITLNGTTVSSNTYRTDNNGNINNSYRFMEEGTYNIEVKYYGDGDYHSPVSKKKTMTSSRKSCSIVGYKTSLWTTNKQTMQLLNSDGTPIVNQNVIFYIHGVYYTRVTNNDGMAELQINLPMNDYDMVISFNDESEINNCNNQKNTHILVNSLYGSTVERFTLTVNAPVKNMQHSRSLASISFNNQSRGWESCNPALISKDNGADYMRCLNINSRTSSVNRPDSLHFKSFKFKIPEDAIIYSITARYKTTYWRVNGGSGEPFKPDGNLRDAYFDPAYCGIPTISTSYVKGVTPFEDMWTESECKLICYGENKQCTVTPDILNDEEFVFALDFGQNRTENIANFGLMYFELTVEYFRPDE